MTVSLWLNMYVPFPSMKTEKIQTKFAKKWQKRTCWSFSEQFCVGWTKKVCSSNTKHTTAIEIHCRANKCHATLLKVWWNNFSHWNTLLRQHVFTRYKQGVRVYVVAYRSSMTLTFCAWPSTPATGACSGATWCPVLFLPKCLLSTPPATCVPTPTSLLSTASLLIHNSRWSRQVDAVILKPVTQKLLNIISTRWNYTSSYGSKY